MNILFFDSERNLGGVERWMLILANAFRQRGHTSYFGGRKNERFLNHCANEGFEILPLEIKSDFSPGNIFKIARFCKRKKIDAIITNLNKDTRLAGIARKFSGGQILVGRHGLPILPNKAIYRATFNFLTDGVITPTNVIKEIYRGYGWVNMDMIYVIHNSVDKSLSIHFERQKALSEHDIPDQWPIIGIFGRMVPQKRHKLFLDIAKKVAGKYPKAAFLMAGDGPLRGEIQQHAINLGIEKNVFMLGFQKAVMPLYSICDLVLQTSEHEGLPNVVLEAMFAGKPVIAFDAGGVREVISNDEVGIVLPLGASAETAAQKVGTLLNSSERMAAMGKNARVHVLENFSREKMIDETEFYLNELLTKHS